MSSAFVDIYWAGRPLRIEHAWVGVQVAAAPLLVFLHEGLGSLAMWKDFPQRLCEAAGCRGLVYSRPGYGRSTPRQVQERWAPDFLHRQARELLPALLRALKVDVAHRPPWLLGHSDGASIALLHAATHAVAGTIVVAPHIFVEDLSIASIQQARTAYTEGALRSGLAKYHDDTDSAFHGWNGIWLDPAFRDWNIESELAAIRGPLLAVQGLDDEYGTLAQIYGIAAHLPQARMVEIADCGHSPHRDHPQVLIDAACAFMQEHR